VRTLDGEVVTDYRPEDHVWHRGIAWSLPVVGDQNFWGGPSYVHGEGYVPLPNNGAMVHRTFTRINAQPARIDIAHQLDWVTQAGDTIFAEDRTLGVSLVWGATGPHAWLLTFGTAMTNVGHEPIALGSPTTRGRPAAGYGGLFWRGPRSFTGGRALTPAVEGRSTGGATPGDEAMGTRHPWLAYRGGGNTLVFVDAPDNLGHPTEWFVRSTEFPGVCPAPFYRTEVTVAPGETLRLRYALAVASGVRTPGECADLAARGLGVLAVGR
jgi:hypothetical protein